jgi:hypothetical protein
MHKAEKSGGLVVKVSASQFRDGGFKWMDGGFT